MDMFEDKFQLMIAVLVVLVLVFVSVVFFGFGNNTTLRGGGEFVQEQSLGVPHLYENPDVKINAIHLPVFYLVASDQEDVEANKRYENLKTEIENIMADVAQFYTFQLRGAVIMTHFFHEEPLYIESEISDVEMSMPNDLNLPQLPADMERDGYTVPIYIITGEGIKESDGRIFLGVEMFGDDKNEKYSATLLAHYLGKSIGLPDLKESSEGLMGLGRHKPINHVFLEREFLSGLGLTSEQSQ